MEIFWRLFLGHLIADFTLQTNYIAAWKRRNIWGMMVHCATHSVIYAIMVWRYLGQVWIQVGPLELSGYSCMILLFVAHLIEDEWRVWSVLKKGAPDNSFFYVWDQIIHYAVLFAVSPVIEGSQGKFGFVSYHQIDGIISLAQASALTFHEKFFTVIQPENWVFVGICLVIVTHFTTVTIYFIEKDFLGLDYPEVQEKYIAMAERLVVTGCFLLPGVWWMSVVAVWLLKVVLYKVRRVHDFSWVSIVVGNVTAIICGLIIRNSFYF